MNANQLLTQKTESRLTLVYGGKIITAKSDVRWCMDIFRVITWDGAHIWVALVWDCHDRQIIDHLSSTIGVTCENIRETLFGTAEDRFRKAECLPEFSC